MRSIFIFIASYLAAGLAIAAPEPSVLNPSGLPVPRYVALKSDDVNLRVGPGTRYPIRWHYGRARLPVQIIEEFAHWRKIQDHEGTSGWVHKSVVDGRRTVLVVDAVQNLHARPDTESPVIVQAKPLVIASLLECQPDWCRVGIQDRKAWVRKSGIWGVTREEVFSE